MAKWQASQQHYISSLISDCPKKGKFTLFCGHRKRIQISVVEIWSQGRDNKMGRLGVQLESSLIILFAVQKIITMFAEKGGKSEICVVQSISVGESSFFLLYIVLAASS